MAKMPAKKNSVNIYRIVTHKYLNDKGMKQISPTILFDTVTVLYLHNNKIERIEHLECVPHLESLYLQRNCIGKIENLQMLKSLRRLYLGHNCISVVENLENLDNLVELHVERQNLPDGECLCFDPRTVMGLAGCLETINVTGNNMSSISSLSGLRCVTNIVASHNRYEEIDELCEVLRGWHFLKEATFEGNPISKKHRYREDVIANVFRLEMLDGKHITQLTRCFIKNLENEKITNRLRKSVNVADHIDDVPKNYSLPMQKAVSVTILNNNKKNISTDSNDIVDERKAIYIPWKALPKNKMDINRKKKKNISPRQRIDVMNRSMVEMEISHTIRQH